MILKPIWTYDIVLCGCANKSNIAVMQTYQSKFLRIITKAPSYVTNQTRHTDLQIPFVHKVFQDRTHNHRVISHQPPCETNATFRTQQELKTKMDLRHDKLRQRHWTIAWITDATASTLAYRKQLYSAL
jgi:hypothetical protein